MALQEEVEEGFVESGESVTGARGVGRVGERVGGGAVFHLACCKSKAPPEVMSCKLIHE